MCGGVGHRLHASQVFARGALGHHVALHRSWKSCMPDLAVPMPQHRRASAPSVFGTKECQAATFAQHHVTHCILDPLDPLQNIMTSCALHRKGILKSLDFMVLTRLSSEQHHGIPR